MFKSIIDLAGDVAKTAIAPVEMAVDLTRVVTKPLADAAGAVRDEVKETIKDMSD